MLIAAIDIGTNSIHMVIARAVGPETFEVVDREREVVQIGRGSFAGNRLKPEAIQRTVDSLARFVKLARRRQVDRILCTATAAVREARNGGDFLAAAARASGITPRVIPGEEEGRLIYLAVKSALQLDHRPALIVDIGGGSVQLVVGNRDRLLLAVSAPLGALRLTEKLLESDPPARRELDRLRRTVRKGAKEALAAVAKLEPVAVYGSSGSIHALAHVAHARAQGAAIEHINGHLLTLTALEKTTRELQRMTIAERESLPGIDAKRAEILVAGAVMLEHILAEVEADGITISDFGVREGLVVDYIASHAKEISSVEQVEDLRLRSVLQLRDKFGGNAAHDRHVAELALALYDHLGPEHALPPEARDLLHYAALLHDVGAAIAYDGHHEHSYYVIKKGNLRGFTAEDWETVASVARYHSKTRPRKRDKEYKALDKPRRRMVRWLAAILRIAEGLDRSHYQLVRSVKVRRRNGALILMAETRRDAQLEIWAARRRTDLLAKLVRMPVRILAERGEARGPTRGAKPRAKGMPARRAVAASPRPSASKSREPAAVIPLRNRPSRSARGA